MALLSFSSCSLVSIQFQYTLVVIFVLFSTLAHFLAAAGGLAHLVVVSGFFCFAAFPLINLGFCTLPMLSQGHLGNLILFRQISLGGCSLLIVLWQLSRSISFRWVGISVLLLLVLWCVFYGLGFPASPLWVTWFSLLSSSSGFCCSICLVTSVWSVRQSVWQAGRWAYWLLLSLSLSHFPSPSGFRPSHLLPLAEACIHSLILSPRVGLFPGGK